MRPVEAILSRLCGGTVMQIPVLVEPVGSNGFRARSGEPLPLAAQGATKEEALQKLRHLLDSRLQAGAELTALEVGPVEHPLAKFAGTLDPADPLVQQWLENMAEYRRQRDEEEDEEFETR